MPDNKSIKAPLDAQRVNLSQPYEVRNWCHKFNCTKDELEKAVSAVGTWADDVEAYLKQQR
ncbi:DUF3606 domain-containing protein [Colwellia sp. MEBiC06753]